MSAARYAVRSSGPPLPGTQLAVVKARLGKRPTAGFTTPTTSLHRTLKFSLDKTPRPSLGAAARTRKPRSAARRLQLPGPMEVKREDFLIVAQVKRPTLEENARALQGFRDFAQSRRCQTRTLQQADQAMNK